MKRMAMGLAAVLLTLVAAPALAVVRGASPSDGPTSGPYVFGRYTLCQSSFPTRVVSVTVTRAKPYNAEHFSFPARTRGTNAAQVRALAIALCSLPAMPAGVQACPADWGANYELQFSLPRPKSTVVVGGAYISPVSLGATGCLVVKGLGKTRWAMGSAKIFPALGAAIGLRHATQATFAGTLAS